MNTPLLVVSNGLISNQGELNIHPDLFFWQSELKNRKKKWFSCKNHNVLSFYGALLNMQAAHYLAQKANIQAAQYWLASPYHAQLARDAVRVMPESMLPWHAEDARWICELLNPFLQEELVRLHAVGAALLLTCDKPWQSSMADFADIAGHHLPNRHPKGEDSGRLMRLMSEIQMFLKQHPALYRRERGMADVHGLWLWGGVDAAVQSEKNIKDIPLATRNASLYGLVDGKDAKLTLSDAEDVSKLLKDGEKLPKQVILMGEKHAVWLKKSFLSPLLKQQWAAESLRDESELFNDLRVVL